MSKSLYEYIFCYVSICIFFYVSTQKKICDMVRCSDYWRYGEMVRLLILIHVMWWDDIDAYTCDVPRLFSDFYLLTMSVYPQVKWKSLQNTNHICGSTVSVHKSKSFVLFLKIEILENNPERCPEIGGLYFSENQDPDRAGEEETILLGRSDFSSTCGLLRTTITYNILHII